MTNEELKVFAKKHPIPVVGVAIVIAVALAVYFRSGDLPAAETELAKKSADAEKYALNITYAAQLKEQLDAITAANKKIESRLTRASQQGINTQYFYKIARETGVTIVSFGQGGSGAPKAAKAAYVPIGFVVAVTGSLPQLLDFLRQLEQGQHYCRITAGTVTASSVNRNLPLTLSLNLELLGQP